MRLIFIILALLIALLGKSYVPDTDFDARLKPIVKPHVFSIIRWELQTLPDELSRWLFQRQNETDDEIDTVLEYFSLIKRIKTMESTIDTAELNNLKERKVALEGRVEKILEQQIRDTLTEQGIYNPVIEMKVNFPPLNFKLAPPPNLLVVSPRERIESMREVTLEPGLSLEEMENIEGRVDELDVSSLVVGLGGLGATYPAFVNDQSSLRYTIDTSTEEWLHQYLAFKPLGFRYVLDLTGISRNYEIATMNETLAGMVSKEIGAIVYEKYYSAYENKTGQEQTGETTFDFNREMREIRKTVDSLLARGEIDQAEEFMEQKRQYLASNGYHIRKLNQAYFAFHGTYADKPAFVSPIGLELEELRSRSSSLKDFLDTVAAMSSAQELSDSLQ